MCKSIRRAGGLLVGLCLLSSHARAQEAEQAGRAEARRLAENGDAAFSEGRCDRAVELWKQANTKFHAPTILVRVAQCEALLGKVVEATTTLESVAKDHLAPGAPSAFVEAQQRAQAELPRLRARVARIRVFIDYAGLAVHPELEIDNVRMATEEGQFAVNPGEHFVHITAGTANWETTVRLGDGESRDVKVALAPDTSTSPRVTQARIGYVLGGVGIGAVIVGSVFGLRALSMSRDLDQACGSDRQACPTARSGDIDKLKMTALVADVTLAAGTLVFAGGSVLVLTGRRAGTEAPGVRLVPTATGAAVVGRF
jgi:hypothetical protein